MPHPIRVGLYYDLKRSYRLPPPHGRNFEAECYNFGAYCSNFAADCCNFAADHNCDALNAKVPNHNEKTSES